jgi:hypothetical protein
VNCRMPGFYPLAFPRDAFQMVAIYFSGAKDGTQGFRLLPCATDTELHPQLPVCCVLSK